MTIAELEHAPESAATLSNSNPMKALVYHGSGKRASEDKPRPAVDCRIILTQFCHDVLTDLNDLHVVLGGARISGAAVACAAEAVKGLRSQGSLR
jgi:hypothetical protein